MYQLTIDVGTTQIKFKLYHEPQQIKELKKPVETYYKTGGEVYQDPKEIGETIKAGIKEMNHKDLFIEEILFSTAMHSIMPVFENNPHEEMIIWLDQRASSWVKKLKENQELSSHFYQKTGTPIHEMSPFAKIGYFQEKAWFHDVKKWTGMKEYLMTLFTGQRVIDYSTASATGLFNSETMTWDEEILNYVSIKEEQLARLVDTDWWTSIDESIAEELSLSKKTKIYIGASDGCLASYASFCANGTGNTVTIGTSGAVRKLSKTRQLDDKGQSFCYYVTPDYWVVGGATNNGGQAIEWASDIFYEKSGVYENIEVILKESPIGSKGIQFLPYLFGERAPLWSSEVTGEFSGLRLGHEKVDIIRSVIEGVLMNIRYIGEIISLEERLVSLSGGFFGDQILVELTADILGKNCVVSPYCEPSYGLICLVTGTPMMRQTTTQKTFFNQINHEKYEKVYNEFVLKVKNER